MPTSQNNDTTLDSENNGGSTPGVQDAEISTLSVQDPVVAVETQLATAQGTVGYEWHLDSISLDETIWAEFDGAGVHVGIYDSGVDTKHPELRDNYDASLEVQINGVTYGGAPSDADDNHGTAVAGLIGARNGNGGTTGVAPKSSLTGVNLNTTPLIEAVYQMAKFDVTNNSWGIKGPDFAETKNVNIVGSLEQLILRGYAQAVDNGRDGLGTVIVQSAGNDDLDANGDSLSASRFTVTVAATNRDGFAADFSN
jgi:subtilisin family serine protease